jgi:membrane protease subunit (stomatin/prohibitin family)
MGLFSFVKSQLIDVISWIDESNGETVVWKFPDNDREIKNGAQLTVMESQVALLVNEGKLADVYPPGRHELVTRNMPILTTLKSWKYGFSSPFKVDVYFVNTKEFADQKWGTQAPVEVFDQRYGPVPVRAFGTYNFKITDAAKFFRELAGTDPHVTSEEIMDRFRTTVVSEFGNVLVNNFRSVADIYNKGKINQEILPLLRPEFERFGMTLMRFNIASVTLPENISQEIREGQQRSYQKMEDVSISQNVGDMNKYMMFQMGQNAGVPNSGGGEMSEMMRAMMQMQMMQNMMGGGMLNPNANVTQQPQVQQPAKLTREQIMDELKKLGELKQMGVLTEDEFNAKKQQYLAQL